MSEEETETTKKMSEFIPELYFDLISRVIPGSLILTAYIWGQEIKASNIFIPVTIEFFFFSYFIGFIADVVGRPITALLAEIVGNYKQNRMLMEDVSKLETHNQSIIKKLLAEANLLRVTAVLSIFITLAPPKILSFECPARPFFMFVIVILLLTLHVNSQKLAADRLALLKPQDPKKQATIS